MSQEQTHPASLTRAESAMSVDVVSVDMEIDSIPTTTAIATTSATTTTGKGQKRSIVGIFSKSYLE